MSTPRDPDARKFSRVAKQRLAEARTILVKAQLPAAAWAERFLSAAEAIVKWADERM